MLEHKIILNWVWTQQLYHLRVDFLSGQRRLTGAAMFGKKGNDDKAHDYCLTTLF